MREKHTVIDSKIDCLALEIITYEHDKTIFCIILGVATEVECKLYVRSLGSINPDTMVSALHQSRGVGAWCAITHHFFACLY